MDIKQHIRAIADFPKPGILFYDISTLLAHPQAWHATVEQLAAEGAQAVERFGRLRKARRADLGEEPAQRVVEDLALVEGAGAVDRAADPQPVAKEMLEGAGKDVLELRDGVGAAAAAPLGADGRVREMVGASHVAG